MRVAIVLAIGLACFLAGLVTGVIGVPLLRQPVYEGATLREDVTIYNGAAPIAELKQGIRFNREKDSGRCELWFYLDHSEFDVHELVEPYYMDKPSGFPQQGVEADRDSAQPGIAPQHGATN